MPNYQTLSAAAAKTLLDDNAAQLVDIRDEQSFSAAHIAGAVRLDNTNVGAFIEAGDKTQPLIVCCYHGISSRSAAQFLPSRASPKCTVWTAASKAGAASFPAFDLSNRSDRSTQAKSYSSRLRAIASLNTVLINERSPRSRRTSPSDR